MTTIARVWDVVRLGIAVVAFVVAGTMVVLRLREEVRRSHESPSPSGQPPVVSEALRQRCADGSAVACLDLGLEWLRQGTSSGDAEARSAFEKACSGQDAQGCHNLGRMLAEGAGGVEDRAAARAAYVKACDGGLPWACHAGALLLVDDDAAGAAVMLDKACDAGYAAACYELALLVEAGKGVPRSAPRATKLLRSACTAGEGRACAVLGAEQKAGGAPAATSPRT